MAWTLQTLALQNNVPTNGMTVNAYVVTRFALPATDAAVPDGNPADAGPATSAADPVAGAGYFTLVVPDGEPYWLQASGGGDGHTYWYGPIVGVLDTTQQAFGQTIDQTPNRLISAGSTTAVASNGLQLPQPTIYLNDNPAGRFHSGGGAALVVTAIDAYNNLGYTVVQYTGLDSVNKALTGCTGGTGTMGTNNGVFCVYVNGSRRRTVTVSARCSGTGAGDSAIAFGLTRIGGAYLQQLGAVGLWQWNIAATTFGVVGPVTFSVDPNEFYGVRKSLVGNGAVALYPNSTSGAWIETDAAA